MKNKRAQRIGRMKIITCQKKISPPETHREDKDIYGSGDSMKQYMGEIVQTSLLNTDDEKRLAKIIHGKDKSASHRAKNQMIEANLRLVVKIAHDFKGFGLPILDLISEGNIGLVRASEKFDPEKGAKFSSYSSWWIKQAMRRALANQSRTIRIPIQSAGKMSKIRAANHKLTEKLGREPANAEIADFLELSERTVSGLKLSELKTFSIHDPIREGEEGELKDIIPDHGASMPDKLLADSESLARLTKMMLKLEDRERCILTMRFGLDGSGASTLEDVSLKIGRTRERVRQIQNQALSKLRLIMADESGYSRDQTI